LLKAGKIENLFCKCKSFFIYVNPVHKIVYMYICYVYMYM